MNKKNILDCMYLLKPMRFSFSMQFCIYSETSTVQCLPFLFEFDVADKPTNKKIGSTIMFLKEVIFN